MEDNKALDRAELKPCPHCGGRAKLNDWKVAYESGTTIQCEECGACISESVEGVDGWHERAVKKWNRRVESPNEPLTLTELRGMDGEPVWAGNEKEPQYFQWFLVDCGSAYKPFILINRHNNLMWQYMKSPAHPDGWTAYRRKPDGGGE